MYQEKQIPKLSRYESTFIIIIAAYTTVLVLTNIIGSKLFDVFGATLTAGIITYPITFLLTDVCSELYGEKRSRMVVYIGFFMNLLMLVIVQISIYLSPSLSWGSTIVPSLNSPELMQSAWVATFGVGAYLVFGSMLAYMVSHLVDVRVFHFVKSFTGEKYLWLRNNVSTIVAQLIDTIIVNAILFYGVFGWGFWQGVSVMLTIYLFKLAIALIDTPLIYASIYWLKKYFQNDSNN